MTVGFNTIFPKQCPTVFKVKNIAPGNKKIKIFQYPILNGNERDLMAIPYVSEADIRHSLLKGELNIKLRFGEATVVESNIDLTQFDDCHKQFLQSIGIMDGLESGVSSSLFLFKENISLVGDIDGINRTFTTPDKFIDGTLSNNELHIKIIHNGRRLIKDTDYLILESGGVGTGFDTVVFISFVPATSSKIIVDYFTLA